VGVRFVMRRLEESSDSPGHVCPRCDSPSLDRLPNDGISRHPGYVCQTCGLHMQANGSKIVISIVLLISLALLAFFTLPLWAPGEVERLPVVLPVAAAGSRGVFASTDAAAAPKVGSAPAAWLNDDPGRETPGREGNFSERQASCPSPRESTRHPLSILSCGMPLGGLSALEQMAKVVFAPMVLQFTSSLVSSKGYAFNGEDRRWTWLQGGFGER